MRRNKTRPIPRKITGELSKQGDQIQIEGILDEGVGVEELYVVKQRGVNSFVCAATADPSRTGTVQLVRNPLTVGEGRVVLDRGLFQQFSTTTFSKTLTQVH